MAAFAGVAATGVVIVRAERRRRACTPQEIRERLHARLAEAAGEDPPAPPGGVSPGRLRRAVTPGRPGQVMAPGRLRRVMAPDRLRRVMAPDRLRRRTGLGRSATAARGARSRR